MDDAISIRGIQGSDTRRSIVAIIPFVLGLYSFQPAICRSRVSCRQPGTGRVLRNTRGVCSGRTARSNARRPRRSARCSFARKTDAGLRIGAESLYPRLFGSRMHARLNDHCTIRRGTGSGRELPPIRAEYYASIAKRPSAVKLRQIRNGIALLCNVATMKAERDNKIVRVILNRFFFSTNVYKI